MSNNTFTITDNRTGKSYELPVEYSTINAIDLRKIKVDPEEFGTMTYDPGYGNTAACKSSITYIDGDKGILRYRGYPIEQLAEHSSFLEVAYLLIYGELPDKETAKTWEHDVCHHTYVHENLVGLLRSFRYDAHPMGMMISALAFMSTMHPEATQVENESGTQQTDPAHVGQTADHRRHRLSPSHRPAHELPQQRSWAIRPTSSTCSTTWDRASTMSIPFWPRRWTSC